MHVLGLSHLHCVGAEPDESHGDPAARVLALHQPVGETHSAADPGDLAPQRQKQVNPPVARAGIFTFANYYVGLWLYLFPAVAC